MSSNLYIHDVNVDGTLYDGDASVAANKLANKQYVTDAIATGGGDWLASVSEQADAPPTNTSGVRVLVGSSGSGVFAGKDNQIAVGEGGTSWDFQGTPSEGAHVFIEGGSGDLGGDILAVYSGSAWVKGASLNGALVASQNLSDVASKSSSRSNLDIILDVSASTIAAGSALSGQVPVANGGTGASTASAGFDALSPMTAVADLLVGGTSGAATVLAKGTAGQVLSVNSGATAIEWAAAGGTGTVTSVSTDADSGTGGAITSSGTIKVVGGTGIETSVSYSSGDSDITVAGTNATATAKGVASFAAADLLVTAGAVTVLQGSATQTKDVFLKVGSSDLTPGSPITVDSSGNLIDGTDSAGVTSLAFAAGSGSSSAITSTGTLTINGDSGAITTSVASTGTFTVSVAAATTSVAGVAKFASADFSVSSGEVTLDTVGVASGGTGLTAVTTGNILYASGTNTLAAAAPGSTSGVQAYDAGLTSIAGLTPAIDKMLYTTGSNTYAATALTSAARGLLDDVSDAAMRTTLGLDIGSDVQAWDADLDALAGLSSADSNFIVGSATGWTAESGATVRTSLGLGTLATQSGTYGTFDAPIIEANTIYTTGSQSIAPSSVSGAKAKYIFNFVGSTTVTTTSSVTLPAPGSTDLCSSISILVGGDMGTANAVTVHAPSGYKISGQSSITLSQDYQSLTCLAAKDSSGASTNDDLYLIA